MTGAAFTGAGRPVTAVLVNLAGSAQNVPVSALVPAGARYQLVTGQPTAQQPACPLDSRSSVS